MTLPQPSKKKSFLFLSTMIILMSSLLVGFIFYKNRETIINFDWKIRPQFILISFFLFCVNLGLLNSAWSSIMDAVGTKIGFQQHFYYFTISNVTRRLPGTIWYLFSRAYFYFSDGIPIKTISLASAIEILNTILSGVIVSTLYINSRSLETHYIISVIVIFCSVFMIYNKYFRRIIGKSAEGIAERFPLRKMLLWTAIYALIWIIGGVNLFTISLSITEISPAQMPYFIGCWAFSGIFVTIFVFLPSTFGILEISLGYLLSVIMPLSVALIVVLLTRITLTVFEIILAAALVGLNPEFKNRLFSRT